MCFICSCLQNESHCTTAACGMNMAMFVPRAALWTVLRCSA